MEKVSKGMFASLVLAVVTAAGASQAQDPKDATEATKAANAAVLQSLPFSDRQSFEDARRGFIAPLPNDGVIESAEGRPVWDMRVWDFIGNDDAVPATVNPSLWRQAQLLKISGLFQVTEEIYQVRGADLANVTFIEGPEGIVVMDPLMNTETAQAALDLYFERHDGQACTIEDWLQVFEDVTSRDLSQFKRWYTRPGHRNSVRAGRSRGASCALPSPRACRPHPASR